MKNNQIKIGTLVEFISGNFEGHEGIISKVDWDSKEPNAIYGFLHTCILDDGRTVFIEKSEHFIIKKT